MIKCRFAGSLFIWYLLLCPGTLYAQILEQNDFIIDSLKAYPHFAPPYTIVPDGNEVSFHQTLSTVVIYWHSDRSDSSTLRWHYSVPKNSNWHPLNETMFIYSNISPGHHELMFMAEKTSGEQVLRSSLVLHVENVFWRVWWLPIVIISYIFFIIVLLYLLFKNQKLKQDKKIHYMRLQIAADLHDEIGSSLASIRLLGENLADDLIAESEDVFEKVSAKLEQLDTDVKDISSDISAAVWAINPENSLGKHLIDRINKTARDLLIPAHITFRHNIDTQITKLTFSPEENRQLLLVVKECFHNIKKHARASITDLSLSCMEGLVTMEICDNGVGFDTSLEEKNDGNGLLNFQKRAEKLEGRVTVESVIGSYTKVRFEFPKVWF